MLQRERNEKLALVRLFASLVGNAGGVQPDGIEAMLELYKQELLQTKYRPAQIAASRRALKAQIKKQTEDVHRLQKVEKLTVEEKDLPPLPAKAKGGRRRR